MIHCRVTLWDNYASSGVADGKVTCIDSAWIQCIVISMGPKERVLQMDWTASDYWNGESWIVFTYSILDSKEFRGDVMMMSLAAICWMVTIEMTLIMVLLWYRRIWARNWWHNLRSLTISLAIRLVSKFYSFKKSNGSTRCRRLVFFGWLSVFFGKM